MKPHKHAELIKLWADGAEIECKVDSSKLNDWIPCLHPFWDDDSVEFRIKLEPKPDVVIGYYVTPQKEVHKEAYTNNFQLTFDGETGELKSAEVLK